MHGHWIEEHKQTLIPVEYDDNGEPILHDFTVYVCSICGRQENSKEPYCNCGARMIEPNFATGNTQKIILEISAYTDGDWGYDINSFGEQGSKYFDNDLFEYTFHKPDDYSFKIKRSFEVEKGGKEAVKNILEAFCNSLYGRDWDVEYITEFIQNAISAMSKLAVGDEYYDDIDSNTEMELSIKIVENDAKMVKEVIFE